MTDLRLPPGYSLAPTGITGAVNLRFNGKDCGYGFLTPPSQSDVDNAIHCHKFPIPVKRKERAA